MVDPAQISNDELVTAACGPEDREEQADLFNRCFRKKLEPEALSWRYDTCPHGDSISFVTRPPGGIGISGYACNPRRIVARGEEATAAVVGQTGDVMTDPAWRKRGIFSDLDRAAMAEAKRLGWPLTIGFPNHRSAHIFLELGWENVGTLRPWSFYLDAGKEARALRAREGRKRALLLPFEVRGCVKGRKRLAARAGSLEAEPLEAIPEEAEELARSIEPRFGWMVRRDREYLRWRYLEGPSGLHRVIGIRGGGGALVGYAVVQLPREGEPLGFLVDVIGRDDAAVAGAIQAGLAELEGAGAHVVQATAIDGSWWRERLEEAGFLAPKPENHYIVIVHFHEPGHPLAKAARDLSSWYFTDGDRDDETMG